MMKEFLLELYTEEIPAKMQKNAEEELYRIFNQFFESESLPFSDLKVYIGPCRIAITAQLEEFKPEKLLELKGPRVDAPETAIQGFCNSNNLKKEDLIIREVKDTQIYFAEIKQNKIDTKELLAKNIEKLVKSYTWPKSMVWGSNVLAFIRPLKNILCLFGGEVVNFNLDHLKSNNVTYGHKFMSYDKDTISSLENYKDFLKIKKVVLDRSERREMIKNSLFESTMKKGLTSTIDQNLLEEVTGLAEFPVVLIGTIADKFMELPPEVLVTSMKIHQKYFTCNYLDGKLAPFFLFVTNLDLNDYSHIISGNERVLSARLSDALYFYNVDKNNKLEDKLEKLKNVVFHAKIGTIKDKVIRVSKLCEGFDKNAGEAAMICKSDLVSEMVCEFPELQGIMGGYYAELQGKSKEVADAIKHHYSPLGLEDKTPKGAAAILSLMDKIDSLVGLYIAGERATGSKDPYALRRYALSIIRIISDNDLNINLKELLNRSYYLFQIKAEGIVDEALLFIEERLKHYLRNDFSSEIINASINLKNNSNIAYSIEATRALNKALNNENGKVLISQYRRVKNISADLDSSQINTNLFKSNSETHLYKYVSELKENIAKDIKANNLEKALQDLLTLQKPLEDFFKENLVNTEDIDITRNRMALLKLTSDIFEQIANFGEL